MRGAWIEIGAFISMILTNTSLPVRGAWIEMHFWRLIGLFRRCRSPCGERGLKFAVSVPAVEAVKSLPVRGAWIEILHIEAARRVFEVAPRAGSVD